MAKKQEETALAVMEEAYPILYGGAEEASMALAENMAGEQFEAFDLPRLTVPSGSSSVWADPFDEDETMKTVEGIILFQRRGRSYWAMGLDEGGGSTPPDCFSDDGKNGELRIVDTDSETQDPMGRTASPTHPGLYSCDDCPFSKWGSDKKGRGQACKAMRVMFILMPGSFIPVMVTIPPSSLKAVQKFLLTLSGKGIPYWRAVTTLGLEKSKNQDSIDFQKITFGIQRRLSGTDGEAIDAFRLNMLPALKSVSTLDTQEDDLAEDLDDD